MGQTVSGQGSVSCAEFAFHFELFFLFPSLSFLHGKTPLNRVHRRRMWGLRSTFDCLNRSTSPAFPTSSRTLYTGIRCWKHLRESCVSSSYRGKARIGVDGLIRGMRWPFPICYVGCTPVSCKIRYGHGVWRRGIVWSR